MKGYYYVVRTVVRSKPHLSKCLTRCRHCRIYFFTHPCNAGRKDLGCPFGCREAHRKKESTRRSVAYYQDKRGRKKKSEINNRRRKLVPEAAEAIKAEEAHVPEAMEGTEGWNPEVVEHVRMVVSLVEGRRVSKEDILEMLDKKKRQHSPARRRKMVHSVRRLNERPP